MAANAMATCCSQSDRFMRRFSRTMTGRCRSWTRTRQGGNMPILLKTQIERTAKTPVTARRACVGSLCGFPDTAERVPARSRKTGRCADVRGRCGNSKRRRSKPAGSFRQKTEPQAAKQEKAKVSCAPLGRHICPQCGQFGALTQGLLRGQKQPHWGRKRK